MKRAPVDRHDDAGPQERRRVRSAPRIQMARTELRSPASDRQQSDVERGERRHVFEEVRVSGEVDAPLAAQHEADGGRSRTAGSARPGVDGRCRLDSYGTDVDALSWLELLYRPQPGAREEVACAIRAHEPDGPAEPAQRWQVGMVVMEVRDEDGVERFGRPGRRRGPAQVQHAPTQHRVGE